MSQAINIFLYTMKFHQVCHKKNEKSIPFWIIAVNNHIYLSNCNPLIYIFYSSEDMPCYSCSKG